MGATMKEKPSSVETFLSTLLSFNAADFKLNRAFFFFLDIVNLNSSQPVFLFMTDFLHVSASCLSREKTWTVQIIRASPLYLTKSI